MKRFHHTLKHMSSGFTIVEILVVIVVIGILASITVVAYTGAQGRAKNSVIQHDLSDVQDLLRAYHADHPGYPTTSNEVYVDNNCQQTSVNKRTDWVPGLSEYTNSLPQNPGLTDTGVDGEGGCYMYLSDGINFILSAWNGKSNGPSTDTMYRRQGFREKLYFDSNSYRCNYNGAPGGIIGGNYSQSKDYYKYSYTLTSITTCDETPPSGA